MWRKCAVARCVHAVMLFQAVATVTATVPAPGTVMSKSAFTRSDLDSQVHTPCYASCFYLFVTLMPVTDCHSTAGMNTLCPFCVNTCNTHHSITDTCASIETDSSDSRA